MNLAEIRKRQIQYYAYVVMAIIFLMLGKTIGNNGLAYVAVAIETISVFMIFIGDTIADTYAKMIRIRRKRKLHHDVIAIRKRVIFIQIILGMFLFISVLLFADTITMKVFGLKNADLLIRIIVFIILLKTFESLWIGYVQSFGAYIPVALSLCIKTICFGILAGSFCKSRILYGEKVAALLKNEDYIGLHGAIGVAISLLVAEVIVFLILGVYYYLNDRHYDRKKLDRNLRLAEPLSNTIRDYVVMNTGGSYYKIILWLFLLVPMILVKDTNIRGILWGKYLMICTIPICIIFSRISYYQGRFVAVIRNHDNRMIKDYIQTGMQYTWCVSIFFAVLIAVLAPAIKQAYFPLDDELVHYLQYGSMLVVFISMIIYFSVVHLAHNKKLECMISLLLTFILYLLLERNMFNKFESSKGVIYAACISLFISMLLMGVITIFTYSLRPDYISVIVLPLICVVVTGLIVLLISKYMSPHIGNHFTCIVGIVLGFVLYLGSLSMCRVFDDTDVDRLYDKTGKKILSLIFK